MPPVYNGFVLAAVAIGGVGFLAYTGAAFFLGFDALAIGLGFYVYRKRRSAPPAQ